MALSRDLGTIDTSYMTLMGRFEAIKKEAQSLSAINVNQLVFACNVPFPLIIFTGTNALLSKTVPKLAGISTNLERLCQQVKTTGAL